MGLENSRTNVLNHIRVGPLQLSLYLVRGWIHLPHTGSLLEARNHVIKTVDCTVALHQPRSSRSALQAIAMWSALGRANPRLAASRRPLRGLTLPSLLPR